METNFLVIPIPNTIEEEEINNVYVILRSICANQIESEEERLLKTSSKNNKSEAQEIMPIKKRESDSSYSQSF